MQAIEPGFIFATLHRATHADSRLTFVNVAFWESEVIYYATFAKSPVPTGAGRP